MEEMEALPTMMSPLVPDISRSPHPFAERHAGQHDDSLASSSDLRMGIGNRDRPGREVQRRALPSVVPDQAFSDDPGFRGCLLMSGTTQAWRGLRWRSGCAGLCYRIRCRPRRCRKACCRGRCCPGPCCTSGQLPCWTWWRG